MLCLLVALAAGAVVAAPAQVMITYSDIPVYGRDSGINATVDVYLPEIAGYEMQRELGIQLKADLPAVLFVPALSTSIMQEYAQNLTARGYGVIAVDYRLTHAVADSMCALAWAHAAGPALHLDPNHIAAVGYSDGGQIAALMGSADLGRQPTYEGGAVRVDTPAPYPIAGLDRCPYPMPEAPMIEAVATYDADLGTPVALVDTAYQLTALPPIGTTRAQMVVAFNEFAFTPPDEWRSMVAFIEPESATVNPVAADDQAINLSLWQLTPPEVAAMYDAPAYPGPVTFDLWGITPPEVAAMFQEPATVEIPLAAVNEVVQAPADLWQLTPPEVAAMFQDRPAEPIENPNWMTDVAIALPAYWLDGNEPPHLLMVGEESSAVIHADNAIYTELLRDNGVPVQLTELAGCGHDPCALAGDMESLDVFLAEVLFSS
jgi:acetyl esterase/lipase